MEPDLSGYEKTCCIFFLVCHIMPVSTQGDSMKQDHRFAIRLSESLFDKLKKCAAKNRRAIAEQTRIFIEKGLENER